MTIERLDKYYRTKFRDFDSDFTANPDSGDFNVLSHLESVKKRIKNLVLTNLYDRPYAPALGGQVRGMLGENMDFFTLQLIENLIIDLILAFEPAVEMLRVSVVEMQQGNGFTVGINFRVINIQQEAQLEIIYNRVR